MFGIGLPELFVILALALIVVGPDKLPELARSLARGMLELKKTANALQKSIQEEVEGAGKEVEAMPPRDLPPAEAEPEMNGIGPHPELDGSLEELQARVASSSEQENEERPPETGEDGRAVSP